VHQTKVIQKKKTHTSQKLQLKGDEKVEFIVRSVNGVLEAIDIRALGGAELCGNTEKRRWPRSRKKKTNANKEKISSVKESPPDLIDPESGIPDSFPIKSSVIDELNDSETNCKR